jgi:hypothetical protein
LNVASENTVELMQTLEPRWNQKGLAEDLAAFIESLGNRLERAKAQHAASQVQDLEERLATDREFLAQKRTLKKTFLDVGFSDALTVHLGGRELQIRQARPLRGGRIPSERRTGLIRFAESPPP